MSKLNYSIRFYDVLHIERLKHSIIEGMEDFLAHSSVELNEFSDLQPFTIAQNITLKLPWDESLASQVTVPTYARIQAYQDNIAQPDKIYYFFVEKFTRLANKTIAFDLIMDTLNSFSSTIENGMSKRTMVAREHKDRFTYPGAIAYPLNVNLIKKIDKVGEGFSATKIKVSDKKITAPSPLAGLDWYLIYKSKFDTDSTETNNPVSCYLCASDALVISKGSAGGPAVTLNYDDLVEGKFYYLTAQSSGSFSISYTDDNNNAKTIAYGSTCSIDRAYLATHYVINVSFLCLYRVGSDIRILVSGSIYSPVSAGFGDTILTDFPLNSDAVTSVTLNVCRSIKVLESNINQLSEIEKGTEIVYNAGTGGDISTLPYSLIGKSDSTLVKIIRLPYAPCAVTYDAATGTYKFPGEWSFEHGLMTLSDDSLATEFSFSLPSSEIGDVVQSINLTGWDNARFLQDPKLFHSDFFSLKYSYDTFALEFKLEYLIYKGYGPTSAPDFSISFKPTNTINSNFLFLIENASPFFDYITDVDYHVLLSSRNNEMTIFSNAYLNYLKTGYNYDKKAKAVESASRWGGMVITAAGAAVSAFAGGPIGALGAVSLGVSAVSQMASAITAQISSDNTQAAKIQELRNQSTSVSGVDDVDLLKAYTDNRLHEIRYEVNDVTKQMLDDFFFYFGYAVNRQKVPNFTGRIWFNYVQCTPYFKDEEYTLLAPYLDDIAQKFGDGVTIFHEVQSKWDLSQEKENLESWFKQ
jgi:hypothetical protein